MDNYSKKIIEKDGISYAYADMASEYGSMALILPYRKHRGKKEYLLERNWLPGWDVSVDICGIAVYGSEDELEALLIERLKDVIGVQVIADELQYLGICGADRHTNTVCKLYAVDMSQFKEHDAFLDEEKTSVFWTDAESIIESLDPQLHAAYASHQYIFL